MTDVRFKLEKFIQEKILAQPQWYSDNSIKARSKKLIKALLKISPDALRVHDLVYEDRDPNLKLCGGVIHYAAYVGDVVLIEELIKKKNVDPNFFNDEGQTPLHFAIKKIFKEKKVQTIQILLDNGADKNITDIRNRTAFSLLFDWNVNLIDLLLPDNLGISDLHQIASFSAKHFNHVKDKIDFSVEQMVEIVKKITYDTFRSKEHEFVDYLKYLENIEDIKNINNPRVLKILKNLRSYRLYHQVFKRDLYQNHLLEALFFYKKASITPLLEGIITTAKLTENFENATIFAFLRGQASILPHAMPKIFAIDYLYFYLAIVVAFDKQNSETIQSNENECFDLLISLLRDLMDHLIDSDGNLIKGNLKEEDCTKLLSMLLTYLLNYYVRVKTLDIYVTNRDLYGKAKERIHRLKAPWCDLSLIVFNNKQEYDLKKESLLDEAKKSNTPMLIKINDSSEFIICGDIKGNRQGWSFSYLSRDDINNVENISFEKKIINHDEILANLSLMMVLKKYHRQKNWNQFIFPLLKALAKSCRVDIFKEQLIPSYLIKLDDKNHFDDLLKNMLTISTAQPDLTVIRNAIESYMQSFRKKFEVMNFLRKLSIIPYLNDLIIKQMIIHDPINLAELLYLKNTFSFYLYDRVSSVINQFDYLPDTKIIKSALNFQLALVRSKKREQFNNDAINKLWVRRDQLKQANLSMGCDFTLIDLKKEGKLADIGVEVFNNAIRLNTPILIKMGNNFLIFGKDGGFESHWKYTRLDKDVAHLENLPFAEGVLKKTSPLLTEEIIETLKQGHLLPNQIPLLPSDIYKLIFSHASFFTQLPYFNVERAKEDMEYYDHTKWQQLRSDYSINPKQLWSIMVEIFKCICSKNEKYVADRYTKVGELIQEFQDLLEGHDLNKNFKNFVNIYFLMDKENLDEILSNRKEVFSLNFNSSFFDLWRYKEDLVNKSKAKPNQKPSHNEDHALMDWLEYEDRNNLLDLKRQRNHLDQFEIKKQRI